MSDLARSILKKHMSTGIVPGQKVEANNMGGPCGGGKCNSKCNKCKVIADRSRR